MNSINCKTKDSTWLIHEFFSRCLSDPLIGGFTPLYRPTVNASTLGLSHIAFNVLHTLTSLLTPFHLQTKDLVVKWWVSCRDSMQSQCKADWVAWLGPCCRLGVTKWLDWRLSKPFLEHLCHKAVNLPTYFWRSANPSYTLVGRYLPNGRVLF